MDTPLGGAGHADTEELLVDCTKRRRVLLLLLTVVALRALVTFCSGDPGPQRNTHTSSVATGVSWMACMSRCETRVSVGTYMHSADTLRFDRQCMERCWCC
jgi:hypothetical protein